MRERLWPLSFRACITLLSVIMRVWVSIVHPDLQSLPTRSDIVGHMIVLLLVFWGTSFNSGCTNLHTVLPTVGSSLYPATLPAFVVVCVFDDNHSEWSEVNSQCHRFVFPLCPVIVTSSLSFMSLNQWCLKAWYKRWDKDSPWLVWISPFFSCPFFLLYNLKNCRQVYAESCKCKKEKMEMIGVENRKELAGLQKMIAEFGTQMA
jgi:hypothetical protein